MPFRSQYLADVGLLTNPYPNNPEPRIADIYKTSRRGRITHAFALQLWQAHLHPIHTAAVGNALPTTQDSYDSFVVQTVLAIQSTLQLANKGGFGIAQKIFNLFMKDLWGHRVIGTKSEVLLHAPIDRIVYLKFAHHQHLGHHGRRFRPQEPPAWKSTIT
jgi:hypothetical protein